MALRLRGATSGYIELKAPASAGDNTLTLPTNNGSANQLLKTDGSGNLSWVDDNSGVSLSGSTNNTIATVTGANALQGEANLTFDGTTLGIQNDGSYAHVDADELIIGNYSTNAHQGITILSHTSKSGTIYFSDGDNPNGTSRGTFLYSHADDAFTFSTAGGTEDLRIDSSGRMLIGVTASYANASIDELQVGNNNSSNQSGITIGSTDECAIAFADAGDARAGSITYHHGTDAMIFKTVGQNERVRITSDGTVDVSDNVIIHSVGNSVGVDIEQQTDGNYMNMRLRNFYSGAAKNMIAFLDEGGNVDGSIVINNSTTTYNTSSDYRLKENEVLISDGIERLKLLKPYRFNYKKHPGITVDGFFAHEVTPAVPEAVINEKDGEIDKDGNGYQQMDYAKITPLLTAALKEAIAKIETLETKVAALESA